MKAIVKAVGSIGILAALPSCSAPTESDESVASKTLAIYNGNLAPPGFPNAGYDQQETTDAQYVLRGSIVRFENHAYDDDPDINGIGSGTLIRSNVVLTARHVVEEAVNDPELVEVHRAGSTAARGDCQDDSDCRFASEILLYPGNDDVALVFLTGNLQGYRETLVGHGVPIARHPTQQLDNTNVAIGGYGLRCDDPEPQCEAGKLRYGLAYVIAVLDDILVVHPGPSGQIPRSGDSGSAFWSPFSFPPAVGGVDYFGGGGTEVYGVNLEYQDSHYQWSPRRWARQMIRDEMQGIQYTFNARIQPFWYTYDPKNPISGPSNWFLQDGKLWQTSNIRSSDPLHEGTIRLNHRRVEDNAHYSVTIQSNDNDKAGIVFRWFNEEHYYFFAVNEQSDRARFFKRDANGITVLENVDGVDIDWSDGVTVGVTATEDTFVGTINNETVLTATDSDYPIGRFGLYSYAMGNRGGVNFDNFQVTPLDPED